MTIESTCLIVVGVVLLLKAWRLERSEAARSRELLADEQYRVVQLLKINAELYRANGIDPPPDPIPVEDDDSDKERVPIRFTATRVRRILKEKRAQARKTFNSGQGAEEMIA